MKQEEKQLEWLFNLKKSESSTLSQNQLLILRDLLYKKVSSLRHLSYEKQAQIIRNEFDVSFNTKDLILLDEPTVEEEVEDIKLNLKNTGNL